MRNHRRVQAGDCTRPLPAPGALHAELDTAGEQDLHADADAEHRPARGDSVGDDGVSVNGAQPRHTGLECADAGHHQTVGGKRVGTVGRHGDISADAFQRALG